VATVISLIGVDEAIEQLKITNEHSLKFRLLHEIRQSYQNDEQLESRTAIEAKDIIHALWQVEDDPELIKKKRKNLSSLKWSINDELKTLYRGGQNPEGIIIGPRNTFVMCDEAKNRILTTFSHSVQGEHAVPLTHLMEALGMVNEMLSDPETMRALGMSDEMSQLEKLKAMVDGLNEQIQQLEQAEVEEKVELSAADEVVEVEDEDVVQEVEVADEEGVEDAEDEDVIKEVVIVEDDEAILDDVIDAEETVEIEDAELEAAEELEDLDEEMGDQDDEAFEDEIEVLQTDEILGENEILEVNVDDEITEAELLAQQFEQFLNKKERSYYQFIQIEGGNYMIGSPTPRSDEQNQKNVMLEDFYIAQYPVTNALFEIFVEETGYQTTAEEVGFGLVYQGRFCKTINPLTGSIAVTFNRSLSCHRVAGACWYQPYGPGSTLHQKRYHPVVQVSFRDASAFAAWVGRKLPTESQWEAAARTAKHHIYPWGNDWQNAACNIDEMYIADTSPVDQYKQFANSFGLVDMLGNVMEWTLDYYPGAVLGGEQTPLHIVKGGGFVADRQVRLCSRFKAAADTASNIIGFRCVAD
jgi:formylglycine-generating enzyme required for sulfatase activity